jgi:YHS domain-containing protein
MPNLALQPIVTIMKKMLYVYLPAALLLASCNTGTKTETTTTTSPAPEIKVADLSANKDYVCGMELADGGVADTAQYDGKVYGFCATECKQEFLKNPGQYLSQK